MNPLQRHIQDNFLSEETVLNHLQDHGAISDLCVSAEDVCPEDCLNALRFLIAHPPPNE